VFPKTGGDSIALIYTKRSEEMRFFPFFAHARRRKKRRFSNLLSKKERKKVRENNGASRTREARSGDLILIDEFLCFEMKQAPPRNTLRVSKFFS